MATTQEERRAAVEVSAEARKRRRNRRLAGVIARNGVLVLLILTAVVMSIGFSNSWWVVKHPAASSDQLAADGSSLFTQAGIDYFTRIGTVNVSMTPSRPSSASLGLTRNGTKRVDFLVPLTLTTRGASVLQIEDVDSLDVVTSDGRISALEMPSEGSFRSLMAQVDELAPIVGWSESDVSKFDSDVKASRVRSNYTGYSATIGPAANGNARVSATLSASATQTPTLVVRIAAARTEQ